MNIILNHQEDIKQLNNFLYKNLAAEYINWTKNTSRKQKAMDGSGAALFACARRLNKEDASDLIGMFLAVKQDLIKTLVDKGLTTNSFASADTDKETNYLFTSLKNYMIDQQKHETTGQQQMENGIMYLESEQLQQVTNVWENKMIASIEEQKTSEQSLQDLWVNWGSFVSTLHGEDLELTMHWFPGNDQDVRAMSTIAQRMSLTKRQVQVKIERLRASFKAFMVKES